MKRLINSYFQLTVLTLKNEPHGSYVNSESIYHELRCFFLYYEMNVYYKMANTTIATIFRIFLYILYKQWK